MHRRRCPPRPLPLSLPAAPLFLRVPPTLPACQLALPVHPSPRRRQRFRRIAPSHVNRHPVLPVEPPSAPLACHHRPLLVRLPRRRILLLHCPRPRPRHSRPARRPPPLLRRQPRLPLLKRPQALHLVDRQRRRPVLPPANVADMHRRRCPPRPFHAAWAFASNNWD